MCWIALVRKDQQDHREPKGYRETLDHREPKGYRETLDHRDPLDRVR